MMTIWMIVVQKQGEDDASKSITKILRLFWKPETGNRKPSANSKLSACSSGISLTWTCPPPPSRWQKKIRKTSATLARNYRDKPRLPAKYHAKSNKIAKAKKILAKNSHVGRESDAPPAILASEPASPAIPSPDSLETQNSEPETAFPEKESAFCPLPSANCLYDETAARADELFEIAHGYKRHNPPKHIPNRRREEDFRSSSIFRDLNKYF